jgi:hypothetical protein
MTLIAEQLVEVVAGSSRFYQLLLEGADLGEQVFGGGLGGDWWRWRLAFAKRVVKLMVLVAGRHGVAQAVGASLRQLEQHGCQVLLGLDAVAGEEVLGSHGVCRRVASTRSSLPPGEGEAALVEGDGVVGGGCFLDDLPEGLSKSRDVLGEGGGRLDLSWGFRREHGWREEENYIVN